MRNSSLSLLTGNDPKLAVHHKVCLHIVHHTLDKYVHHKNLNIKIMQRKMERERDKEIERDKERDR